jgi:hypothetical protein
LTSKSNLTPQVNSSAWVFCYNDYRKSWRNYTRLNLLQYQDLMAQLYGQGISFLTLTQVGFKSAKDLRRSLDRVIHYLKRHYGLRFYITASEYQKRGSIHYHIILFDVPMIDIKKVESVWGEGFVKINRANNSLEVVYYLISYLKDGLRLSWSYSFKNLIPFANYTSLIRYERVDTQGAAGVGSLRWTLAQSPKVSDLLRIDLMSNAAFNVFLKHSAYKDYKVNKSRLAFYRAGISYYKSRLSSFDCDIERSQNAMVNIRKYENLISDLLYNERLWFEVNKNEVIK